MTLRQHIRDLMQGFRELFIVRSATAAEDLDYRARSGFGTAVPVAVETDITDTADSWEGLDCSCGGGSAVGHMSGCPEVDDEAHHALRIERAAQGIRDLTPEEKAEWAEETVEHFDTSGNPPKIVVVNSLGVDVPAGVPAEDVAELVRNQMKNARAALTAAAKRPIYSHPGLAAPYGNSVGLDFDEAMAAITAPVERRHSMTMQFGGDHYRVMAMQPYEFTLRNGWDGAAHGILKYISRHARKDGIEGLRKAWHIVAIREDFMPADVMADCLKLHPWGRVVSAEAYGSLNSLPDEDTEILIVLEAWVHSPWATHLPAILRQIIEKRCVQVYGKPILE